MQFTPLKDFHDADLRSDYCVGCNYTVRPGNAALAEKVEAWVTDGKVRIGNADNSKAGEARITGAGKVE
jgi:hypothetical protein